MNEPTNEVRHHYLVAIRRWCALPLSNPHYDELNNVLDWYEKSAGERDELRGELVKVKAQRDRLAHLLAEWRENTTEDIPYQNCSCHVSPPCNDCVEWSYLRELYTDIRSALAEIEATKGPNE